MCLLSSAPLANSIVSRRLALRRTQRCGAALEVSLVRTQVLCPKPLMFRAGVTRWQWVTMLTTDVCASHLNLYSGKSVCWFPKLGPVPGSLLWPLSLLCSDTPSSIEAAGQGLGDTHHRVKDIVESHPTLPTMPWEKSSCVLLWTSQRS